MICPRCEVDKPRDSEHFGRARIGEDGLSRYCRSCLREIRRRSYARHKVDVRAYTTSPRGRYLSFRQNANVRGIEFSLSLDDMMAFWQVPCFYCGEEIPSVMLDRIDNSKGYDVGNVRSCCRRCNEMKMNEEESAWMLRMARVLNRYYERQTEGYA